MIIKKLIESIKNNDKSKFYDKNLKNLISLFEIEKTNVQENNELNKINTVNNQEVLNINTKEVSNMNNEQENDVNKTKKKITTTRGRDPVKQLIKYYKK